MGDTSDLHALVLRFTVGADGTLPARFGHQAQALFLDLVRQTDPALAAALHLAAAARPYTIAGLAPGQPACDGRITLRAGAQLMLRVSLLRGDLRAPLTHALLRLPAVRLGALPLALIDLRDTPERDPWAGSSSFAALVAAARPARRLTVQFVTPTAFSLSSDLDGLKRIGVLPDPQSVFGSLLRRWNALAPTPLDEGAARRASAQALVAEHQLRTTVFSLGKATQVGFLGRCVYELRGDASGRQLLALLGDAAFYLGVGMKTTRGMGLCRCSMT